VASAPLVSRRQVLNDFDEFASFDGDLLRLQLLDVFQGVLLEDSLTSDVCVTENEDSTVVRVILLKALDIFDAS
jgi:hypothetical protein